MGDREAIQTLAWRMEWQISVQVYHLPPRPQRFGRRPHRDFCTEARCGRGIAGSGAAAGTIGITTCSRLPLLPSMMFMIFAPRGAEGSAGWAAVVIAAAMADLPDASRVACAE